MMARLGAFRQVELAAWGFARRFGRSANVVLVGEAFERLLDEECASMTRGKAGESALDEVVGLKVRRVLSEPDGMMVAIVKEE